MQNYDLLIERIVKSSGLEKEEIERRVEAKKAKLSGLISNEGAVQIIAAELGISFEDQDVKINELMPGMRKVNLVGKIINLFPVREFERNGRQGKVVNFDVADETGNLRVVLWDTNHIELIEKGDVKQDSVVEIKNGSMRDSELHLSGFSEFKKSEVVLENVKTEIMNQEKEIVNIDQGQRVKLRGVVVQMFNPRFFSVCIECGKKVLQEGEGWKCDEHGKVQCKERAVLSLVLDDGTETIRGVLFSDQINKLIPEEDLRDADKLLKFRDDLLGSEVYASGFVKKNQMFGNLEVTVRDVEKVDVDKLIGELEKG